MPFASPRVALPVLLILAAASSALVACGDDGGRGPTDGSMAMDSGISPDADVPMDSGVPGDGAVPPTDATIVDSPLVDPGCVDGMYSETLPTPGADISDLIAGYSPAEFQTFIDDILDRRYPVGGYLVAGGRMNASSGTDCDRLFVGSDAPSSDRVFERLEVIVHECGHFYDLGLGSFGSNAYVQTRELSLMASMGASADSGGRTFARNLLTFDDYAALRPGRAGCRTSGDRDCDFYWETYIDPDQRGSDQGFNMVLEETNQYVHSLANQYAFADRLSTGRRTSAKDGILTFLWYVERYLRLARLEHPDAHAFLLGDAAWREAILTIWGRAWLYLELTRDITSLGISDAALFDLVEDPDLVAEIQRVRDAHGCTP